MSKIEVETHTDRIVNTTPSLHIDMSKVELVPDEPASKPRIEIPERLTIRPSLDSDSSDEGKADAKEFDFAVNKKKFNPVIKETIDIKNAANGPIDTQSQISVKLPARPTDTDSERSKRSNRSRRSSGRDEKKDENRDKDSEYRPRYSSGSGSESSSRLQQPPLNNFLGSNMFSTRKSYEAMSSDDIRREKSHFLQAYEAKNRDNMYSRKHLTMDNDLEEIRNELEFITRKRERDNSMEMWKRGLLLFVDGVVMVNNYANDPFDVDLGDWSKEMHWDVHRAGKYDEVLEEMVEKWRGKMPMSAEWKLVFMMGSSLVYGVMQKKQEKAQMAKRIAEQKKMEEMVKNQVSAQIAQMQFMQNQAPQQSQQHNMNYGGGQQQQRQQPQVSIPVPGGGQGRYQGPPPVHRPSNFAGGLQGPTFSDADIMRELERNFIDSTLAGDMSTDSSRDDRSRVSSESRRSRNKEETTAAPRRGRPRKNKQQQEERTAEEGEDTATKEEKVISVPSGSTPAGVLPRRRGPGRPKKNAGENQNAVVLEL